ncbi:MAG: response regulator [Bacteroidota bacterium]
MMERLPKTDQNILVVDDSQIMRLFMKKILSQSFEVQTVDSAVSALESLYTMEEPSLVISDINLPEMNGFDLLKKIKTDNSLCKVPVMIVSGEKDSSSRIKCLELGAVDYVLKPFNPRELYLRVCHHLNINLKRSSQSDDQEINSLNINRFTSYE